MSIPDYFIKEVHDKTKYMDSVLIYFDPSRVYQFERDMNYNNEAGADEVIIDFLCEVYDNLSDFYLIKLLHEEEIHSRYVVNSKEEMVNLLLESFKLETAEGLVIHMKKSFV